MDKLTEFVTNSFIDRESIAMAISNNNNTSNSCATIKGLGLGRKSPVPYQLARHDSDLQLLRAASPPSPSHFERYESENESQGSIRSRSRCQRSHRSGSGSDFDDRSPENPRLLRCKSSGKKRESSSKTSKSGQRQRAGENNIEEDVGVFMTDSVAGKKLDAQSRRCKKMLSA